MTHVSVNYTEQLRKYNKVEKHGAAELDIYGWQSNAYCPLACTVITGLNGSLS